MNKINKLLLRFELEYLVYIERKDRKIFCIQKHWKSRRIKRRKTEGFLKRFI